MKNEINVTYQPSAGNRTSEVAKIFSTNYGRIMDVALSDRHLLVTDAERIVNGLANHLDEYEGPIDIEPFLAWASEIVHTAATKLEFFYDLYRLHRKSVLAGVWSVLYKNRDLADHTKPAYTARYIAADVWRWVFMHLDDLALPGTAKLSVRLYSAARFQALTWRKTRLRELERFVDVSVEQAGDQSNITVDEDGTIEDDRPISFEPDYGEDDDDIPLRPANRPHLVDNEDYGARSGTPRLLCPKGCGLRDRSSVSATGDIILVCGHERPSFLPPRLNLG